MEDGRRGDDPLRAAEWPREAMIGASSPRGTGDGKAGGGLEAARLLELRRGPDLDLTGP